MERKYDATWGRTSKQVNNFTEKIHVLFYFERIFLTIRLKTPARLNILNNTLKSPIPENYPGSPRISSIKKCLNSPRTMSDTTPRSLYDKFDEE